MVMLLSFDLCTAHCLYKSSWDELCFSFIHSVLSINIHCKHLQHVHDTRLAWQNSLRNQIMCEYNQQVWPPVSFLGTTTFQVTVIHGEASMSQRMHVNTRVWHKNKEMQMSQTLHGHVHVHRFHWGWQQVITVTNQWCFMAAVIKRYKTSLSTHLKRKTRL